MTAASKTCPTCGLEAPPEAAVCPHDGAELVGGDEGTLIRDPLIGQPVGEYRVRRRIGSGGMGIVYEAVHPIIGKRAAVKVLKPELAEDPDLMERLLSEARAIASIQHRSVIAIFGFGQLPDGRHYMVMEYLDGEPLDFMVHRVGKLPLLEALTVFDSILAGLGAAHAVGVIHRDLKPSNVILVPQPDGSREVKVLDFGLAKHARPNEVTPQTVAGRVLGTPEYMAPEQARGLPISARTDLYAAGVLAYELVVGEVPFSGPSPVEVMLKHLNDAPPRPSAKDPTLPRAFDELIGRLLAKDAAERPASAEEVRGLIARITNPVPTAKLRPSRPRTNAEVRGIPPPPAQQPGRGFERTEPMGRTLSEADSDAPKAVDATMRELPQVAAQTDAVKAHDPSLPAVDQVQTSKALPRLDDKRPSPRATPYEGGGLVPVAPTARLATELEVPKSPSTLRTEELRQPPSPGPIIGLALGGVALVAILTWALWPGSPSGVDEPAPLPKPPPALSVDPVNAKTERATGNLPPEVDPTPPDTPPQPPTVVVPVPSVSPTPSADAGAAVAKAVEPRPPARDAGPSAKADPHSQKALLARIKDLERQLGSPRDSLAAAFLNDFKADLKAKPSAAERRRIAGELDEWESKFLNSR